MQRQDLERMTREQLIAQAERLGIPRPRVLTQPELIDEIIGRTSKSDRERTKARGWLGRARDLLARVVDRGLHLPEAARVLRKDGEDKRWPAPPPPLPTVTLAEIYAAQGHLERAIAVLGEVIAREPDHRDAKAMLARFTEQAHRSRARVGREKDAAPKQETAPLKTPDDGGSAPPMPAAVVIEAAPASKEEDPTVVKVDHAADADVAAVDAPPPTAQPASTASAPDVETPSTEPAPQLAPETPALALAEPASAEPAPPVAPLDEPPLPDRYEVDEIVAIAVDPRTIYLYWEVRPTTLAHVRQDHPDGGLCIRVATVIATWEGPVVDTRDLLVDALYGDRFLRDIQPGSNVRVSVGWRSAAGFEPLAVGSEVTAPRAVPVEPVTHQVARWEAEPVEGRFQSRRIESVSFAPPPLPPSPYAARLGQAPTPEAAAASAAAFVERAEAASHHGGPVDTGVALWGPPTSYEDAGSAPYEEEFDEAPTEEAAPGWFEPGGSSELGRGGPGQRMRPARGRRVVPGGPSRSFVPGPPRAPGWSPPLAPVAPRGAPGEAALGGASDLSPGGASEHSF